LDSFSLIGILAGNHLRQVLAEMGAPAIPSQLPISKVQEVFDDNNFYEAMEPVVVKSGRGFILDSGVDCYSYTIEKGGYFTGEGIHGYLELSNGSDNMYIQVNNLDKYIEVFTKIQKELEEAEGEA